MLSKYAATLAIERVTAERAPFIHWFCTAHVQAALASASVPEWRRAELRELMARR